MGRIIIKAAKDRDLYMEWSTIVESPTFIGDRADTLDYLRKTQPDFGMFAPDARLERADRTGTSAVDGYGDGEWEDEGFIVEQRGWLPRAKLAKFLDLYDPARPETFYALLEPFEDEEAAP